jgi:predicted small lipoprotein YifL
MDSPARPPTGQPVSRNHFTRWIRLGAAAGALAIPCALVSACGQKGPLYLPPRNGTVVTHPAGTNTPQNQAPATPQTTTPEDKKKNDDSAQPPK